MGVPHHLLHLQLILSLLTALSLDSLNLIVKEAISYREHLKFRKAYN